MSVKRGLTEEMKRHFPNKAAEISQHASNPVFQDLSADMIFLIEQIAQSRDPPKRKMLTDLKRELDEELYVFLSRYPQQNTTQLE